jgi:formylglycine-generating enzyme required for sulfatase activity
MKLTLIPPGEFEMGSPPEEIERFIEVVKKTGRASMAKWIRSEGPQRRVRIDKPFYIGKHELTVGQFRKFVEDTGYKTDAEKDGKGGGYYDPKTRDWPQKLEFTWCSPLCVQGEDHPVENVSRNDAVAFCKWLRTSEGCAYRLPTGEEREYCCRAGTTTVWPHGDDEDDLQHFANIRDQSWERYHASTRRDAQWDDGYPLTAPVGQFRPNGFFACTT